MTIVETRPSQSDARLDWGQRVGAFTALPALIRELDGNPGAILADAGLDLQDLDDPSNRIPFRALTRLLRVAAEQTGCAHFGLLAGRMWRIADLGVVGGLVANSRTVGEALETLIAHQRLNSEAGLAFMLRRAGMVDFGYAIYDPSASGTNQTYDAVLAIGMNIVRELCGPGWAPTMAFLPHSKPAACAPYRSVFKINVRFDAETCALRFAESWLERPLADFDRDRAHTMRAGCQRTFASTAPLLGRVYRALRLGMLQGRTSGDEIAQALSMQRRTLNRRLQSEGVTFQRILDDVRFAVASELLSESHLSLDDIAGTLGYAGVSPFMRAFHRWTGHTAGGWRRAAQCHRLLDARRPLLHRSARARVVHDGSPDMHATTTGN